MKIDAVILAAILATALAACSREIVSINTFGGSPDDVIRGSVGTDFVRGGAGNPPGL